MIDLIHSLLKGEVHVDKNPLPHELHVAKIIKSQDGFYRLNDSYRIGKIDIASNGNGYLETIGEKSYKKDLLVEAKDLNSAQKGDIVVAKRVFGKTRPKAKVVKILKRAFLYSVVYTQKINNKIIGVHVKNGLHVNITASQKSLKTLPPQAVLKIDNENGNIVEVLGVLSDESVDEKISLALFGKSEDFSAQATDEAKSYGFKVDKDMYEEYEDFTSLPFCTIDPPDAKDFDDAIYFDKENFTIYVAIADVSSYVYPFSAMDMEARKRGFSIYFPHKSIPMLPRNLSENICSLKPNEDRLAFCFKITLDKSTLKVLHEVVLNVVINSKKRYTYDEIDEFLKDETKEYSSIDKEILKWLKPLKKLTDKLRKKRLENAFEFRSDEVRMQVDEEQHLLFTTLEKETPSHKLIEDCMLLANKAAAKRIDTGIFRNHESPSFEKIEHLLEDLQMIGLDFNFTPELPVLIKNIQNKANNVDLREEVDKLIIKSQKKAKYESLNKGHFGLGFEKYSHFTSPIRRYSDLVLHRLLKAQIANDKKQFNYQLEDIDDLCNDLSKLERESDAVAWDYMDRKFARWAKLHIGEEFKAIVTSVGNTIIAKLDDELKGARLFLLDHDAFLLDRILVKIVSSDIAQTTITAKITQVLE